MMTERQQQPFQPPQGWFRSLVYKGSKHLTNWAVGGIKVPDESTDRIPDGNLTAFGALTQTTVFSTRAYIDLPPAVKVEVNKFISVLEKKTYANFNEAHEERNQTTEPIDLEVSQFGSLPVGGPRETRGQATIDFANAVSKTCASLIKQLSEQYAEAIKDKTPAGVERAATIVAQMETAKGHAIAAEKLLGMSPALAGQEDQAAYKAVRDSLNATIAITNTAIASSLPSLNRLYSQVRRTVTIPGSWSEAVVKTKALVASSAAAATKIATSIATWKLAAGVAGVAGAAAIGGAIYYAGKRAERNKPPLQFNIDVSKIKTLSGRNQSSPLTPSRSTSSRSPSSRSPSRARSQPISRRSRQSTQRGRSQAPQPRARKPLPPPNEVSKVLSGLLSPRQSSPPPRHSSDSRHVVNHPPSRESRSQSAMRVNEHSSSARGGSSGTAANRRSPSPSRPSSQTKSQRRSKEAVVQKAGVAVHHSSPPQTARTRSASRPRSSEGLHHRRHNSAFDVGVVRRRSPARLVPRPVSVRLI